MKNKQPNLTNRTRHYEIGDVIRIHWSNGHGFSEYQIADNPDNGPHILIHLRNCETQSDGTMLVTEITKV